MKPDYGIDALNVVRNLFLFSLILAVLACLSLFPAISLFKKARKVGAPITYFRIEGMDHWLRKRPDVIDQSFEWLKAQIRPEK